MTSPEAGPRPRSKKPKPPPVWPGPSLCRVGLRLCYQREDYDDSDGVAFHIRDTGEAGERLIFEWVGADNLSDPVLEVTEVALQSARRMLRHDPDGVITGDGRAPGRVVADHMPPFLLCRESLLALRSGLPFTLAGELAPDRANSMRPAGTDRIAVKVGKKTRHLPVLVARGEDIALWLVNDAQWPVLIRREEDECVWRLNEISRGEEPHPDDDEE